METQTEEPKQSLNQTTTTKPTEETRQDNTPDLLNPMSGYVQDTNPNLPNTDVNPKPT
jgi:hypothetical protein